MRVLNPTAREKMTDPRGRPYFLWDMDISLDRFEEMLGQSDEATWCYLVGKLMRQAKPDDVFHAMLYCLVASFIAVPREDLLGLPGIPQIND